MDWAWHKVIVGVVAILPETEIEKMMLDEIRGVCGCGINTPPTTRQVY